MVIDRSGRWPSRVAKTPLESGIPATTNACLPPELRVAWRKGIESGLAQKPQEVVPYKILPSVVEAVQQVRADQADFGDAVSERQGQSIE